jgi:two-component system sensor histidine kinase BaeS
MSHRPRAGSGIGIGPRIAIAALGAVAVAILIVTVGVLVVAASTFTDLMVRHGADVSDSQAMFEETVASVFVVAAVLAVGVGAILAVLLGSRLGRPLREMALAARRIAGGDYAVRVEEAGPAELADLAASLNQMAESLALQERERRELIADTAHELRTPLTNLQGYLEALRDGVVQPEEAAFRSLWEETERLVRLSRDLDVLAEGVAPPHDTLAGPVDVADATRNAVELTMPSFRSAGIEVTVDARGPLVAAAAPDDVARVLANLLQNAARYTPAGGSVAVTAGVQRDVVIVSVANSGPGIPADDLPRVFERFFRVDRSRHRATGGAGIGLAIVKELVERWGGSVGVESEPGATRFWFGLPAAD